jgi:hypothetical protein
MTRTSLILALTLGMGAVAALPSVAEAGVYIGIAPPEPIVEERPVAPYEGAVWQPGYYDYHRHHHVWVKGRYVRPHHGHVWEPHHWVRSDRGWRLERGHWR